MGSRLPPLRPRVKSSLLAPGLVSVHGANARTSSLPARRRPCGLTTATDRWNIDAALDALRCEQMPQIVMGDAMGADFLRCPINRFLAFADLEHFGVQ